MKEILKYLRTVNGFSQEQVAQRIGLSRQSYNKYEAGTVIPSGKVLQKIADIYKVKVSFIKENRIPQLPGQENKKELTYGMENDSGERTVASATPTYEASRNSTVAVEELDLSAEPQNKERRTYDAYFSGNSIRLVGYDVPYKEGQRLKVIIEVENEDEEIKRKAEAWEKLQSFIGKLKLPKELESLTEKEIMHRAWEEKFGKYKS